MNITSILQQYNTVVLYYCSILHFSILLQYYFNTTVILHQYYINSSNTTVIPLQYNIIEFQHYKDPFQYYKHPFQYYTWSNTTQYYQYYSILHKGSILHSLNTTQYYQYRDYQYYYGQLADAESEKQREGVGGPGGV